MRVFFIIYLCLAGVFLNAQVGINNTDPKATLHIDAKNPVTPESTAGLGVPVLDKFPDNNPTNDQNGMLIYLRNTTDTNLEGFYYWDAEENQWEYIVDSKSAALDISKTIASGNAFSPNNISGSGAKARVVPFVTINSPDSSFSLENGGLKVKKTATYYLIFTGGVFKSASNTVNDYTTNILINGVLNSVLSSTNSAPGGPTAGRSATFYIATIINLNEDDILTVRTSRDSTGSNTVSVDTPYTLTLINLD